METIALIKPFKLQNEKELYPSHAGWYNHLFYGGGHHHNPTLSSLI